jgi:hypothetical protein
MNQTTSKPKQTRGRARCPQRAAGRAMTVSDFPARGPARWGHRALPVAGRLSSFPKQLSRFPPGLSEGPDGLSSFPPHLFVQPAGVVAIPEWVVTRPGAAVRDSRVGCHDSRDACPSLPDGLSRFPAGLSKRTGAPGGVTTPAGRTDRSRGNGGGLRGNRAMPGFFLNISRGSLFQRPTHNLHTGPFNLIIRRGFAQAIGHRVARQESQL